MEKNWNLTNLKNWIFFNKIKCCGNYLKSSHNEALNVRYEQNMYERIIYILFMYKRIIYIFSQDQFSLKVLNCKNDSYQCDRKFYFTKLNPKCTHHSHI